MKVILALNQAAGDQAAFNVFQQVIDNGARVLGLATGSTPEGLYRLLRESSLDFSAMTSVNLDEYVGIAPDNPQSYHYFMNQHLFNAKPFAHSYLPNGLATDPDAEVKRYDQVVADNPVDLQLLGIGRDGHIGFNEPGSPFDGGTHRVKLTESTIEANARFFASKDEVPREAYTMGIGTILKSREILLMAYGDKKADAVQKMVEGPLTTAVAASALQKMDNVVVIVDPAAAAKLQPASISKRL